MFDKFKCLIGLHKYGRWSYSRTLTHKYRRPQVRRRCKRAGCGFIQRGSI